MKSPGMKAPEDGYFMDRHHWLHCAVVSQEFERANGIIRELRQQADALANALEWTTKGSGHPYSYCICDNCLEARAAIAAYRKRKS